MQLEWDDSSVARKRDDRVKFEKDKVERICIMDAQAEMKVVHYLQGMGYIECGGMGWVEEVDQVSQKPQRVLRFINPSHCKFHAYAERDPEERYAARIIVYNTDMDGMPLSPLNFTLKWWAFGRAHFATLRMLRKQFGDIRMRDLLITCTNSDYQHIQLTPANEAWWLMNEPFKLRVAERYKQSLTAWDLAKLVATTIPPEKQDEFLQRVQEKQSGGRGGFQRRDRGRGGSEAPAQRVVFEGGSLPPPPTVPGVNPFTDLPPLPQSPFSGALPLAPAPVSPPAPVPPTLQLPPRPAEVVQFADPKAIPPLPPSLPASQQVVSVAPVQAVPAYPSTPPANQDLDALLAGLRKP